MWEDLVEVVESDMREFRTEEKADLVISELLGGFSDNELSPECLDAAVHLMKGWQSFIPKRRRDGRVV